MNDQKNSSCISGDEQSLKYPHRSFFRVYINQETYLDSDSTTC